MFFSQPLSLLLSFCDCFFHHAVWSPLRLICQNFKKEIVMVLTIEMIILAKLMLNQLSQLLEVQVELYKLCYLYLFLSMKTWFEDKNELLSF